jgi:bacterioferritin (cytochrome b1)
MISDQELYVLSYYRACELGGAILFGRLAYHTSIDAYRIPLTEHSMEESEHAWLWTKTIRDLGHVPLKVTNTYQTEYGKLFGMPENILEIFCLTQIFEQRTLEHFHRHLALTSVHPLVKAALEKMIADETGHIGWIRRELDAYAKEHGRESLDQMMEKLQRMDNQVYAALAEQPPFNDFFKSV